MKHTSVLGLLLVAMLVTACADSEAPSVKEASDIIYGTFFRQPTIVKKTKCEMTPEMETDGATIVWLIEYRYDERFETDAITIMKRDGDWVLHSLHPFCPGNPPSK